MHDLGLEDALGDRTVQSIAEMDHELGFTDATAPERSVA